MVKNKKSSNGKRGRNGGSNPNRQSRKGTIYPPQLVPSVQIRSHRFRYVADTVALTNQSITCANLIRMLCACSSVGTAIPIIHGLKLKSIEAWCKLADLSAPLASFIQIEFRTDNADFGNPSRIYSDVGMGSTDVSHVYCEPEPDSFSGMWLPYASTDTVVRLTLPVNTIIDFVVDMVLLDGEAATAFGAAGATTLTLGGYTLGAMSPMGLPDFG